MRATPVEAKIRELIEEPVQDMGYTLVRIKQFARPRGSTLQVMAERKDGAAMTVEDCEDISRQVSALLDVEDPIKGNYNLEVSSPGIDRPLIRPEDFIKFTGFEVKLETSHPIEGRKRFRGVLTGLKDEMVEMTVDKTDYSIPLDAVDEAKLVLTDELIKAHQNGYMSA